MHRRLVSGLVLSILLSAVAPFVLGDGALRLWTEALLILTMAQMWNQLAGYAGLVSLGHQVFVAAGAYALFLAAEALDVSPYLVLPLAPLAAAGLAALIALPLFRLREAYFSIGIWVFSEIVATLVTKSSLTGATAGVPLKTGRLIDLDWFEPTLFWLASAMALAATAGLLLLMRSELGLGIMSVRDNDVAAMSVGVDVQRNRLIVFVVSAAGCGTAGAVNFLSNLYLSPASAFDVSWVVDMMFIVVIGGIGTLEGPIIGTLLFFALREIVTGQLGLSAGWYLVALGSAAVATMLWSPRGLWPALSARWGLRFMSVQRKAPRLLLQDEPNNDSPGTLRP